MAVWCTTLPAAMHHLCGSSAPFRRWRCTIIRGQAALLGRHMQEAEENGALEVILNNDSWETDEDYLKLVLADYTKQVLEYQSEHPGASDAKK